MPPTIGRRFRIFAAPVAASASLKLTLDQDAAMTTSPALNSSTVVSTTVPAVVPLVSEIRNALNAPRVGVTARI
jgi:hypothetical protein